MTTNEMLNDISKAGLKLADCVLLSGGIVDKSDLNSAPDPLIRKFVMKRIDEAMSILMSTYAALDDHLARQTEADSHDRQREEEEERPF